MKNTLKRLWWIPLASALALVALLVNPLTLFAISAPDGTPEIYDVSINRNLAVSGDVCIYGRYDIPYTTVPDERADYTYVIRLIDTDNVTYKGAVKPYVYFDNGYNDGVFSLYFTSGIVWNTQYILRISQNPAYFTSPLSYDYVIAVGDYSTETSQEDNQYEMASNVINLANFLEAQYPTYTLLEGGPAGTILASPQGETYFRGAIPGIQVMAPSLYLTSVVTLDYSSNNWTLTKAEEYAGRYSTSEIAGSENATATQFGVTRQTVLAIPFVIIPCLGVLIVATAKFKKSLVGILVSSVLITMGYTLGWVPPAIFATVHQLMAIYTSYVWFLARS